MKVAFPQVLVTVYILLQAMQSQGSESSVFTKHPENQTTRYGEIAEFRCRVLNFHSYSMEIFLGDTKYYGFSDADQIINHTIMTEHKIDHREMNASYERVDQIDSQNCLNVSCEQGIGIFWIVVNNKTLQLVDSVWCRATVNGEYVQSYEAYVNVIYPENCSTECPISNSGILLSHCNFRFAQVFLPLLLTTLSLFVIF